MRFQENPNTKIGQMKKTQRNERILFIAAGFLLFSIVLMIFTIPGLFIDRSPMVNPQDAIIGSLAVIIIHLLVFILFIKFIRDNRRNSKNRKGEYIGIGIILTLIGLFMLYAATTFLPLEDIVFAAVVMFTNTFCDFAASTMIILLFFLNPQKAN